MLIGRVAPAMLCVRGSIRSSGGRREGGREGGERGTACAGTPQTIRDAAGNVAD